MMSMRKLFLLIPSFLERWDEVFFNFPLWEMGIRVDCSRSVVREEVGKFSPASLCHRREVKLNMAFSPRDNKNSLLVWVILPVILVMPVLSWGTESPSLCAAGE